MGVSTDAILFWGYCFTDEDEYPWKDGDEDAGDGEFSPDERYAKAVGIEEPDVPYEGNEKLFPPYWDKKRKAYEKSGCDVGFHCSDGCTMHYVCVSASETTAHRGYPEKISTLDVDPDWPEKLQAFVELMKIKTKGQKPRWWLVSYWG